MQLLGQERWLAGYPNAGIANRPTCQTRFWPGRQYTNLLGWLQERLVLGNGSATRAKKSTRPFQIKQVG